MPPARWKTWLSRLCFHGALWGGLLVIVRIATEPVRTVEEVSALGKFPPQFAEAFSPYAGKGPDARWAGCWLSGVKVSPDTALFEFQCPPRTHAEIEVGLEPRPPFARIGRTSGDVAAPVLAELTRRLDALLPEVLTPLRGFHVVRTSFGARVRKAWRGEAPWTSNVGPCLIAVASLGFMWAFALGAFGFGRFCRTDGLLLLPAAAAVAIRFAFVLHANSEITTYFPTVGFSGDWTLTDKHSQVFAGLKAFLFDLGGLSHETFMAMNGVVGGLASIPVALFVRRRTGSAEAGFFAALLFAVHPLIARFGPTDAQISFLLFWWFAGLALLSDTELRIPEIVGGFWCLGIAATMRIEGLAYLAVALLLVRWSAIRKALPSRRGKIAVAAGVVGAGAISAWSFVLASDSWVPELLEYGNPRPGQLVAPGKGSLTSLFPSFFFRAGFSDALFLGLFWIGVVAAILSRRFRPMLLAAAGAVVALVVLRAKSFNAITEHRLNFFFAMQAVVAGVGAGWLAALPRHPTGRRVAVVALILLTCAIPMRHVSEMRRAHSFNAEYALLHENLPATAQSGGCTLLLFNGGDGDLNNPDNIVPGIVPHNCARRNCVADIQRGGCLFFLRGSGCNERDLAENCRTLLGRIERRTLAERETDFDETFGEPGRMVPSHGTVGLYEITGMHPSP